MKNLKNFTIIVIMALFFYKLTLNYAGSGNAGNFEPDIIKIRFIEQLLVKIIETDAVFKLSLVLNKANLIECLKNGQIGYKILSNAKFSIDSTNKNNPIITLNKQNFYNTLNF